jgi:hypothetical protein
MATFAVTSTAESTMKRSAFFSAALLLAATAVSAHHSAAMFDASKEITLTGTVKEFQWMSPHCWIQLLVPDVANANAPAVEWGIEMDNPVGLSRHGWKPRSLQPGDKVTVIAHPLRDGSHGAQVVSVAKNGQIVGNPEIAR